MKAWLLFVLLFFVACSQVPEDVPEATIVTDEPETVDDTVPLTSTTEVPVNMGASTFEFEGFAPGKSHVGTFDAMDGVIVRDDAIVGFKGTIQAASVSTGIGNLDDHLKTDDFFDVVVYPEIMFTSTSLDNDMFTGDLTFHGVTNEVSFPVTIADNTITADFLLDTTPFNMKYLGVDKDVRIAFMIVAQ